MARHGPIILQDGARYARIAATRISFGIFSFWQMNISNPSSRKRQKLELFSSAYFYFLTGATRSSKQSEILRRNIENKNGHICEEMYDSQITHGIYSKNTPWEELSEMKNESIIGSSPKVEVGKINQFE